jgi:hypothetical protein
MATQTILLIGEAWQLQIPITNVTAYNIVCKPSYQEWDTIHPHFLIDGTKQWQENIDKIEAKQVTSCLHAPDCLLEDMPKKSIRFIAWDTFIQRGIWEYSGVLDPQFETILANVFQKKMLYVPNEIGLVSGQIICGIINEAFLTFEEGVSKKEDINIAMKLGTNYPYGPFEWYERIGNMEVKQVLTQKANLNSAYKLANTLLI